jgi:hypothetical protein
VAPEAEAMPCDLCGQVPCDWEKIWDECNSLKEQGQDNKAVRYHAYRVYNIACMCSW